MATNETEVLKCSGDYLLAPYLTKHDYVLVPGETPEMVYHEQMPECLQNFSFVSVLKHPEVTKRHVIKV